MPHRKAIATAAALLLTALVAFVLFFDANRLRGPLEANLGKRLGRRVSAGPMSLKLFPLSLRVANVTIGQPVGFVSQNPFLQAKEVFVAFALLPLLRGEVDVLDIELQSPAIELLRNPAGEWNYTSTSAGQGDTIPAWSIRDGSLALTDPQSPSPRSVYDHIDARWSANRRLEAKARLETLRANASADAVYENGRAQGTLTLQADGAPQPLTAAFDLELSSATWRARQLTAKLGALTVAVAGTVSGSQLELTAKTEKAPVGDVLQLAGIFGGRLPPDLKVNGLLSADLAISGTTSHPLLNGRLEATQSEFSSKELAAPVRASALRVAMTPTTLTAEPFTLETGGAKLLARATIRDYSGKDPLVEASLRTDGASVEELLAMASAYGLRPPGVTGSGSVSLDLRINNSVYSGSGSLRGVTLAAPALPKPLQLAQASVKFAADSLILDNAQFAIGSTHGRGSFTLQSFTRPKLTFQASVDQINPAEWQTAGPPSAAPPLTAHGTLTAGRVLFANLPLEDVKATIAFANRQLTLQPFTARLFGGQHSGTATVDLGKSPAALTLDSKFQNIEAAQLLAAASPGRSFVSGPLSGRMQITLAPRAGEPPARSLNGNVELLMANGKLTGVQMLNEMAVAGKLLGFLKRRETFTEIVQFRGTFRLANGVANTSDLTLNFGSGQLTGEGAIGLADQTLNLRLTTLLGREAAAPARSGGLGAVLGAILAGPQGQIVIPTTLTGTFTKPRLAPDAGRTGAAGLLDRFQRKK
ncbi:MAG: AsmA family protein [Acidobacteria bacterium]|nr:AsmA family protein [Acidobacteriota bacterium]